MKQTFLLLVLLGLSVTAFCQTPQLVKYQAVIRDNAGQPLPNQDVGIEISILHNSTNGNVVYAETHSKSTNQFGLINLEIGSGNVSSFANINWGDGTYFLQLGIDETGGNNYNTMGVSQLLSVPYSLYAKEAERMDRWYPNQSRTLFSPDDTPEKGIAFGKNSNNTDIYTISAYDQNPGTIGPEKLMIYGEHLYLNDNNGWKLYNVGVGVPPDDVPKEKLHVKGKIYVDDAGGIIMRSPDGACWGLEVSNSGSLSTTLISCP